MSGKAVVKTTLGTFGGSSGCGVRTITIVRPMSFAQQSAHVCPVIEFVQGTTKMRLPTGPLLPLVKWPLPFRSAQTGSTTTSVPASVGPPRSGLNVRAPASEPDVSRAYAEQVLRRLYEYLIDIDKVRGTGRLFLP
jgi:hypothetical protein